MNEKMIISVIMAISLMVLLLIMVLAFPQLFNGTVEASSFAKGIASALGCCLIGVLTYTKYDKKRNN